MHFRIKMWATTVAVGLSYCVMGCSPPPVETAENSTPASSRSPVAAGTGSETQQEPATTSAPTEEAPAQQRRRSPSAAGMGGGSSSTAAAPTNTQSSSSSRRSPSAAGMGGGAGGASQSVGSTESSTSASDSSSSSTNNQESSSSNQSSSGQSSTGQSGSSQESGSRTPPGYGGSDYGRSSSEGRQRNGPPPGYQNPYSSRSGQDSSSRQGGPPSTGSGSGSSSSGTSAPPPTETPPQESFGGAGGASMSLPGEAAGGPPTNNGGGAGGAEMALDGQRSSRQPGNGGNQPAAPAKAEETSFYNMAINKFTAAEDYAGLQLLEAELATNRQRFEDMPLGFWKEAKTPTLGIRMGIGINYAPVGDFSGKPPVIGDPAPQISRNGSGRPGSSGGPPAGMSSSGGRGDAGAPDGAREFLEYYAGDITGILLDHFDERYKESPARYGSALASLNVKPIVKIEESKTASSGASSTRRRGPASAGSDGSSSFRPGSGQGNGPSYGFYPGLVFLGEGTPSELQKKAKDDNLDGVIVIQQKAQMNRKTQTPSSETTVEFYLEGKKRGDTKTLYYQMVAQDRSGGEDPVVEEVKKLFEKKMDRFCTVVDMPTLTEEQCVGRLKSIMEQSKSNPLPFLMEANFYVFKGWLPEDIAQANIIELIGEENALKVFSSDFEKQKEGLKKWLPK